MQTQEPSLFDLIFDYFRDTEPPLLFYRWSTITCLSAYLGRQTWLPFGSSRIFPNQYVLLLGDPGSRKSTAIKNCRKLFALAGYQNFAATKTTKEKFLLDLEGVEEADGEQKFNASIVMQNLLGEDVRDDPREVFIVADEFNDFMRCGDLEFHSMLGVLWDWDDETIPYEQRLKNSRSVKIWQPTITLLGGNTHAGFAEMFPPQTLGQGFLSRMLLIFSEPSNRKNYWPKVPKPEDQLAIIKMIKKIKEEVAGPMTVTPRGMQVLEILYNTYQGFADIRFTSYFTRRYTHLLKLCILCAAIRFKTQIGIEDIVLANTILSYAEHFMPKALGEFGKAKNADVANKILQVLSKVYIPMPSQDIWKQVNSDLDRIEDLDRMLMSLAQAGKIQWVAKGQTNGTPGYLIVRKPIKNTEVYVDWSLLREYEMVKL